MVQFVFFNDNVTVCMEEKKSDPFNKTEVETVRTPCFLKLFVFILFTFRFPRSSDVSNFEIEG